MVAGNVMMERRIWGIAALCVAVAILASHCESTQAEKLSPEFVPPDAITPSTMPSHTVPAPKPVEQSPTTGAPHFTGIEPGSAAPTPPSQSARSLPGPTQGKDPLALIQTEKGPITLRLFRQYAPNTVNAFMELVQKGFYNGLTFHRVEPGFVIQGGCPHGNGTGFYIDPVTNKPRFMFLEISPKLRHNAPGVVAMAHLGRNPHTASCQFYITLKALPQLDNKYSIFAGVISGMDVVNKIAVGDKIVSITLQEQQ